MFGIKTSVGSLTKTTQENKIVPVDYYQLEYVRSVLDAVLGDQNFDSFFHHLFDEIKNIRLYELGDKTERIDLVRDVWYYRKTIKRPFKILLLYPANNGGNDWRYDLNGEIEFSAVAESINKSQFRYGVGVRFSFTDVAGRRFMPPEYMEFSEGINYIKKIIEDHKSPSISEREAHARKYLINS